QQTGTNDPLYDWELARAHYEMESYREALKYYEKAYTNLNQNGDFLKEYGYFLIEEGRTSEAIPVFESYLQIEPSDVEVYEFVERLKLDEPTHLGMINHCQISMGGLLVMQAP